MASETRLRGILEITTAILLGLVSVATAVGAYQASLWSQEGGRLESISGQLRDRSLSEYIATDLASFDDAQRVYDVFALELDVLEQLATESPDPVLIADLRDDQAALLAGATPILTEEWEAFVDGGYLEEDFPLVSPAYNAALVSGLYSANRASAVADELADRQVVRGVQWTVASVVFALALLLLGVSGVSSSLKVAFGLTLGGALSFCGGIAIAALALVG